MPSAELGHYEYLLRVIRENQRKTIVEWNALIRTALAEIDSSIGRNTVSEDSAVYTFEEYRKYFGKLAAERGFNIGVTT